MPAAENNRTRCEVYSRIVGYLRPVSQWNEAKQSEFGDRQTFDKQLSSDDCLCQ
jgi:ribonucleoside-triphosphate reductase (formate)